MFIVVAEIRHIQEIVFSSPTLMGIRGASDNIVRFCETIETDYPESQYAGFSKAGNITKKFENEEEANEFVKNLNKLFRKVVGYGEIVTLVKESEDYKNGVKIARTELQKRKQEGFIHQKASLSFPLFRLCTFCKKYPKMLGNEKCSICNNNETIGTIRQVTESFITPENKNICFLSSDGNNFGNLFKNASDPDKLSNVIDNAIENGWKKVSGLPKPYPLINGGDDIFVVMSKEKVLEKISCFVENFRSYFFQYYPKNTQIPTFGFGLLYANATINHNYAFNLTEEALSMAKEVAKKYPSKGNLIEIFLSPISQKGLFSGPIGLDDGISGKDSPIKTIGDLKSNMNLLKNFHLSRVQRLKLIKIYSTNKSKLMDTVNRISSVNKLDEKFRELFNSEQNIRLFIDTIRLSDLL